MWSNIVSPLTECIMPAELPTYKTFDILWSLTRLILHVIGGICQVFFNSNDEDSALKIKVEKRTAQRCPFVFYFCERKRGHTCPFSFSQRAISAMIGREEELEQETYLRGVESDLEPLG